MELFTKAMENDLAYVTEHAQSLSIVDAKGKTLLHYAVLGSAFDVIEYLLNQDIDVNKKDYQGETPLFDCARKGKIKIAKMLLMKYADVKVLNDRNESLLHLAAQKGDMDFIMLLKESDCPMDIKTSDDKLPIHYAILAGNAHLINYFIDNAKLSWFYTDTYQNTFLHYAAQTTNHLLIDLFLDQSLDPNALNDQFESPLFMAARYGTLETIHRLLKNGAYIQLLNRRFETPKTMAKFYENEDILDALRNWEEKPEYIQLVKEQGLTLAVLNRDHIKLKELIVQGQKLSKDRLRLTALDYAVKYKLTVCITLLRSLPIVL